MDGDVGPVAQNFVRMRQNGVAIDEHPPADVIAALHAAATQSIHEWQSRAGEDGNTLLAQYLARRR